MKLQEKTYNRILENMNAVEELFNKEKVSYNRDDFKEVSSDMGISIARIKRAYENLSEFGYVNLSLGHISNAIVVPNKPTQPRRVTIRRRNTNNYIKRKDDNYVEIAKRIIHDRVFTNLTAKEISERWNCSKGRVSSLVNELNRYGGIKLLKQREYSLIDIKKYKDVDIKNTIYFYKNDHLNQHREREDRLRQKLLIRVLKESLKPNTEVQNV